MPYFSLEDFFSILVERNSSIGLLNIIGAALSGDKSAKGHMENIAIGTAKKAVMDTAEGAKAATGIMLDSTAYTAGFVSDVSGAITLGAATFGRSDVASVSGTISTASGGIQAAALIGKAILTGKESDIKHAKRNLSGFTASYVLGNAGILMKGSNPLTNTAIIDQIIDFSSVLAPELYKTIGQ
jgi:hypothetical protein